MHLADDALSQLGAGAVKAAGLVLCAYTLDDPARAAELFGWGVDAVFSDAPDIVLAGIEGE